MFNYSSPKGIYIHIPFCYSKCNYCSFYSVTKPNEYFVDSYVKRLIGEINHADTSKANIESIYFGGGTPNYLSIKQIESIVTSLEQTFQITFPNLSETTIELNPKYLNIDYLRNLKSLGFNRISLGIQSLNNNLLKLINRNQTREDSLRIIDSLVKLKFSNISTDLMFGLPNQTLQDIENDLDILTSVPEIKHYSVYSLTLEPGTILHRRISKNQYRLMDEDLERDIYYFVREYLKKKGIYQYEISNYSFPGFESKMNNLYWNLDSYFGFGVGASSFLNGHRIDHHNKLKHYINSLVIPEDRYSLNIKEAKEEFLFLGLRRVKGISDNLYKKYFNSSLFKDFKEPIDNLINEGYLIREDNTLRPTEKGLDFSDYVSIQFI